MDRRNSTDSKISSRLFMSVQSRGPPLGRRRDVVRLFGIKRNIHAESVVTYIFGEETGLSKFEHHNDVYAKV